MPCKYVDDCGDRPCYETEHECRCNCEHGGLDPNSKECRCKNFETCIKPRLLADDCSCKCPDGTTWNGTACVADCPPGQRRNKSTGICQDVHCWRPRLGLCGCEPALTDSAADCLANGYKATKELCEQDHPCAPGERCYECADPSKVSCVEIDNPKIGTPCADQGFYDTRVNCEIKCVPPKVNTQCWDCEDGDCKQKTFYVSQGTTCNDIKTYDNEAACRQYGNCGSTPGGGGGGGGGGGAPVACTPPFPPPMGQPLFCQDGTQYGLTTYRVDPATCQWVEVKFIFGGCAGNGGEGGVAPPADGGGVPGEGCTPPVPPPDVREMVCGMMVPKLRGAVVECWATYTEYEWCTECSPTTGLPLLKGVKNFSTSAKGGEFKPWSTNDTAPDLTCPGPGGGGGGGGSGGPGSSSNGSVAADPADPQLEARAVHIPGKSGGAGTELKALLALVGITSTPTCKCNARAKEMDVRGIKWVEENRPTVLSWLKEEAERRKLPFFPAAGRMLIKRAIENAKRKGFK